MTGPFSSPLDPEFIRELFGGAPRQNPTDPEVARAIALLRSTPRPDRGQRAILTLARRLREGGEVDAKSLGHADRIRLGHVMLIVSTLDGPRGPVRSALAAALQAKNLARLNEWIIDTTAGMRRDREAQNAG